MQIPCGEIDLNVEVVGRGPDVILLHPFPSNHTFWSPVVERLESRFRLIMPDLRGLGASAPGDGIATMTRHAEDVRIVCDQLSIGKAVFAGCSIGGYIVFECWRQFRERFKAMVLCDTKAAADDDAARENRERAAQDVLLRGPELYIHQALQKLVGKSTQRNRPDLFEAARTTAAQSTAQGIAAVQRGMAVRPDSTPILCTINVPTLVLCGEEDTVTPLNLMQAMARAIPGSRYAVIPAAGHFAPLERSEDFARLLRQFLESLPAS